MNIIKKAVDFLKEDSFASWITSLILIFIGIKFILFPLLSLLTGTNLPLVVVESCSMHHSSSFDSWWKQNGAWYEKQNITQEEFSEYSLHNGFSKGDVIIVNSAKNIQKGDVIIFAAGVRYPIIHRLISDNKIETKGDNNLNQLNIEMDINEEALLGKAVARIPYVGWVKLIFFEPFRSKSERGFC